MPAATWAATADHVVGTSFRRVYGTSAKETRAFAYENVLVSIDTEVPRAEARANSWDYLLLVVAQALPGVGGGGAADVGDGHGGGGRLQRLGGRRGRRGRAADERARPRAAAGAGGAGRLPLPGAPLHGRQLSRWPPAVRLRGKETNLLKSDEIFSVRN